MPAVPGILRPLEAADLDAVARLDRTYATDYVYTIDTNGEAVALSPVRLDCPQPHTFPFDPAAEPWDDGAVIAAGSTVVGVCAVRYHEWNRRLAIVHYYVDRAHRRNGFGRMLMEWAVARARALGARTLWAETANTNQPGIAAYRRLGFQVCGFDASHYAGTSAEGTFAVFLSRRVMQP